MTSAPSILSLLLVLGLGLFFGVAFEEFYARLNQKRPGGVRTFPLLALTGALLYRLDPAHLLPLSVGLLALSAWLTCYYWRHLDETDAEGFPNVGIMVPICNVIAYLLGPVSLAEPAWCDFFSLRSVPGSWSRLSVPDVLAAAKVALACRVSLEMVMSARARLDDPQYWPVNADGQALPFKDGAFDAVICQLGLQFFPNNAAGLSEFRRVVRVGGTVAVCVCANIGSAAPVGQSGRRDGSISYKRAAQRP